MSYISDADEINAYSDQIKALLDLMMSCEGSVDVESIRMASEMCYTMHNQMMKCVANIGKKAQNQKYFISEFLSAVNEEEIIYHVKWGDLSEWLKALRELFSETVGGDK